MSNSRMVDGLGDDSRNNVNIIIIVALVFYAIVVLRNAWVCDDAYISFRVIDNFVHGYGLTWNVGERVQAFTNPLWLFIHIPIYAIFHNIYFVTLFISLTLSLASVWLMATRLTNDTVIGVVAILGLSLSNAFIDYSTSGLENPAGYFLIILFILIYFKDITPRRLFYLTIVTSLAALNRLDNLVIYLPPIAYTFWKLRNKEAIKALISGFLPLVIWEIFSLIYYGYLFPNTFYAKVMSGIPSNLIIEQGLLYVLNLIVTDPLSAFIILTGIIIIIIERNGKSLAVLVGVAIYIVAIVRVGGDFMAGRFFSLPLLAVVALSIRSLGYINWDRKKMIPAFFVFLLLGLSTAHCPLYTGFNFGVDRNRISYYENGICDEQVVYLTTNGLIYFDRKADTWPSSNHTSSALYLRQSNQKFAVRHIIGALGYFAGPGITILDNLALADPLLSRLPASDTLNFRIGHLWRNSPLGYEKSLQNGVNEIEDDSLSIFYDKVRTITRGDIWSIGRFQTIINMNLGRYDHLKNSYLSSNYVTAKPEELMERKANGTIWNSEGTHVLAQKDLIIKYDNFHNYAEFDMSRDHNDLYRVTFLYNDSVLSYVDIPPAYGTEAGLRDTTFAVPENAVRSGYNRIKISAISGDDMYSVGHLIPRTDTTAIGP